VLSPRDRILRVLLSEFKVVVARFMLIPPPVEEPPADAYPEGIALKP